MARAKKIGFWSVIIFPLKILSWLIIAAFFSGGIYMFLVVGIGYLGYVLGVPWLLPRADGALGLVSVIECVAAALAGSFFAFRLIRHFS